MCQPHPDRVYINTFLPGCSSRGNRIILRRQTGVIYAAELLGGAADVGLDEALLRQNFNLAVSGWSTEKY